jgi:hypothetical protein
MTKLSHPDIDMMVWRGSDEGDTIVDLFVPSEDFGNGFLSVLNSHGSVATLTNTAMANWVVGLTVGLREGVVVQRSGDQVNSILSGSEQLLVSDQVDNPTWMIMIEGGDIRASILLMEIKGVIDTPQNVAALEELGFGVVHWNEPSLH